MIVAYICIGLLGLFVIYQMSDIVIDIFKEKQKEREELERQRHDCNYCYFYRDGKCHTQFEQDCRDNNFFVWYPKDKDK